MKEHVIQVDKQQILSMLKGQGKNDEATQADSELPDQVDTEQHASFLDKLGINVADIPGAGGIAGKLGL